MKLASFDIFDTTLIRKCGKPESIFHLLAHHLYPNDEMKREEFFIWRSETRVRVPDRLSGKECTLADIYSDPYLNGFPEYTPEQMMETEMQTERDNLIPNPEIADTIRKYRQKGYAIAFISDMYLPSAFLIDVLRNHDILTTDDYVFVSCEHNARKDNGKLYSIVRETLQPQEWLHFGDNRYSDYRMARKQGIKAELLDYWFNDAEKRIMSQNAKSRHHRDIDILVGYSRAWRIRNRNNCFAETAADFTASAYIPYVRWILSKSIKRGIDNLYFLSRDGYVLMKIAESLNADNIGLKYLFVSRKSLTSGFMADFTANNLLSISEKGSLLRKEIRALLNLLQTSRDELIKYGVDIPEGDRITSKKEQERFLKGIFESSITPILKERAKEKERLLDLYFSQEGLFDQSNAAMVDVGWLGTSRLMINGILNRKNHKSIPSFYYGVRKDVLSPSTGDFLAYFMPDQVTYDSMTLIENYFSASPYQSTLGYKKNGNGMIEPVFREGKGFHHSEVSRANMEACQWIAAEISNNDIFSEEALSLWSRTSIDVLTGLKANINLESFANTDDFDTLKFVKKLNIKESVKIALMGKMTTAFDRGSLYYTFGRQMGRRLDKLSSLTGRIRRKLFMYFLANK